LVDVELNIMDPKTWLATITSDGRLAKAARTLPSIKEWCDTVGLDYSYLRQMLTGKQPPAMRTMVIIHRESDGAVELRDWIALQPKRRIKEWTTTRRNPPSPRQSKKYSTSRTSSPERSSSSTPPSSSG
jgi:hypothetical protein